MRSAILVTLLAAYALAKHAPRPNIPEESELTAEVFSYKAGKLETLDDQRFQLRMSKYFNLTHHELTSKRGQDDEECVFFGPDSA